jgi:predicted signal transduction protein with EAL and GGDEF domain
LGWTAIGYAASVLPIIVNHTAGHFNVLVDILSPAPIANVLFIVAALALFRDAPPAARSASRFVAGLFLFNIVAVTLSGGVASYPGDGKDWDALFAAADRRLYAAKSSGRNRVEGPEEVVSALRNTS